MHIRWKAGLASATLALPALAFGQAQGSHWTAAQAAFAEFNDRQALELLRQGAESGDQRAVVAYGLFMRHGHALISPTWLVADSAGARRWLSMAVPPPDPAAQAAGTDISAVAR